MKLISLLFILILSANSDGIDYKFYGTYSVNELGSTEFNQIIDFKIFKDYIFITDFKGPAIYKFSLNGNLITKSGRTGRGPGEFVYGPRHMTFKDGHLFVTSMMPWINIYYEELNFKEQKRFINFASNIYGLHYSSDNLVIVPTQFYEENIILYDLEKEKKESLFLNFEIAPGLLSKYDLYKFNNNWLFTWYFQNRFELYDSTFTKIDEFTIKGFPEKAAGNYSEYGAIPKEATKYRLKMYKKGTFFPFGYFFYTFTQLGQDHLLVQLGVQTGGGRDKALIIDLNGNIEQRISLPVKNSKVLSFYNDVLYLFNNETRTIAAYNFRNVD